MTLPLSLPPIQIAEAAAADPRAVEFLISNLSSAAFSLRFASALTPVPAPAHFLDPHTHEVRIDALRAALLSLPPAPSALADAAFVAALPRPTQALLHDVLFCAAARQQAPALRVRSVPRAHPAVARDGARVGPHRWFRVAALDGEAGRRRAAFDSLAAEYGTLAPMFHGSHAAAWYGILMRGLKNFADDPAVVQTGRAYGDGIYLGETFGLANSFATGVTGGGVPWRGPAAVTGAFQVVDRKGEVVRRRENDASLPENYVVVRDEAAVLLTDIIAVLPRRRRVQEGKMKASSRWNVVAVMVVCYALGLFIVGGEGGTFVAMLRRVSAAIKPR